MESANDDTEVKYDVQCNRAGPALNVSIKKENTDLKIPCFQVASEEPAKILDADFTLALRCPKFPSVGKCNVYLSYVNSYFISFEFELAYAIVNHLTD